MEGLQTIDECVKNELPVLLYEVVDVSEDTAVPMSAPNVHFMLLTSATYHMFAFVALLFQLKKSGPERYLLSNGSLVECPNTQELGLSTANV